MTRIVPLLIAGIAATSLYNAGVALAEPAKAPAPGVTTQYNPKELGVDKIQSPRDSASGQATGVTQSGRQDANKQNGWFAPELDSDQSGMANREAGQAGQGASFTSAEGRSMSFELNSQKPGENTSQFAESGRKAEEMIILNRNPATESPQGMVFTNDTIDKVQVAAPGPETYREGGVNDQTTRRKNPRRNRDATRVKRQQKP